MIIVGLFLGLGGFLSLLFGCLLNVFSIAVGLNYLSGGDGRPGTLYIIVGIAAVFLGLVILIAKGKQNNRNKKVRSTVMISGIVSVIVLGILFISCGGLLIFLGIQTDSAFKNAWDLVTSYFSYGSYGSFGPNLIKVLLVLGITVLIAGIAMVVLGVLEAVRKKR